MIAMFNKDILDLSVPFLDNVKLLTKTLEWSLSICILNYVFDENYALKKKFIKDHLREELALE
jgi:Autophagy protein ATG9